MSNATVKYTKTDNLRNVTVARAGRILPSSMSVPAHFFQVHDPGGQGVVAPSLNSSGRRRMPMSTEGRLEMLKGPEDEADERAGE